MQWPISDVISLVPVETERNTSAAAVAGKQSVGGEQVRRLVLPAAEIGAEDLDRLRCHGIDARERALEPVDGDPGSLQVHVVSTHEQNLDLQQDALYAAGCERVLVDELSGANAARPGLEQAIDSLREGDVLVVWRLDRLGRSLRNLLELVEQLKERKVGFRSIQESMDTSTSGGGGGGGGI